MILYCATGNAGKLKEFRAASARAVRIESLPGLERIESPEETGNTFEENAILKAAAYGAHAEGWVFADDSGLEVDALHGAPGVRSARYAGVHAGDKANNRLLLERLGDSRRRGARFVCAIALVHGGELKQTFRGTVEGEILNAPRGGGGFGYDPLFLYPPLNRTLAELAEDEKQKISHRGAALREMLRFLEARPGGL